MATLWRRWRVLDAVKQSAATPRYRITIARENTWIETEDDCRPDVNGLDVIVHPFGGPQMMSATVNFKIPSDGAVAEVNGAMYYAYDPSYETQSISLTGQHKIGTTSPDFSCAVDLDTFTLSCS